MNNVLNYINNDSSIAIINQENNTHVTYKEFKNTILEWASIINITNYRSIAISIQNSQEYVYLFFAVVLSRKRLIPIDSNYSVQRKLYILQDTLPDIIVLKKGDEFVIEIERQYNQLYIQELTNSGLMIFKHKKDKEDKFLNNSFSYIVYTSGSSGTPKGILGNYNSLLHFINWEISVFKFINTRYIVPCLTSIGFDASFRDIMVPLCSGGTLLIPSNESRYNMDLYLDWLTNYNVSLMHTVPSFFRLITSRIEASRDRYIEFLKSIKIIALAVELVYGKDINKWNKINISTQLINFYGATETTLIKSIYFVDKKNYSPENPIPIGKGISDTQILCINNNKLCTKDEIGEIFIKTKYVTDGYYKDEELTRKSFVQNPTTTELDIVYKTGDIGIIDAEDNIVCLGRNDRQIKINGIRVEPAEIEKSITENTPIQECIIIKIKDMESDILVCFYINENALQLDTIYSRLKDIIPSYMIPLYFININSYPLNSNNKVDYKKLELIYNQYRQEILSKSHE